MKSTNANSVKVWMPFYIGDYLADTGRLTTEQHGAYLLLLFDYWRNGALPDDDATRARVCRLPADAWSMHSALLRSFFFKGEDGLLHQKRIDAEIDKAKLNQATSANRAKKADSARWNRDAPSNASSIPQALLVQCPSPSPAPLTTKTMENPEGIFFSVSKPIKARNPDVRRATEEIDQVYQAYPLKKAPGAARVAISKAMARLAGRGESDPAAFLVGRIEAMKTVRDRDVAAGRFAPTFKHPATWFNQECYDEPGLEPVKNCILPGGVPGTEAELQAQTGWSVMRGVA